MKKTTVYWLLVVTALFWGANIVAVKQIVSELPPVAAVGMRFFWVSLVLTAWVLFREGMAPGAAVDRSFFIGGYWNLRE